MPAVVAGAAPEVVCIGETMVLLVSEDRAGIDAETRFGIRVAGAESNVASSLARLGHPTAWFSALGSDPFGGLVLADLRASGVDTASVVRSSAARTGLFVKESHGDSTRVHYYRAGSAASRLETSDLPGDLGNGAAFIHLSGTTPALSESCLELARAVVIDRVLGPARVSFDVNYRPGLWSMDEAAPVLAELARASDVVFVGRDEAETVWGTASADAIRAFLPEPPLLVVKDGDVGATIYDGPDRVFEPALRVSVVETVGAGDAFAAGWLAATLREYSLPQRLRFGHLVASRALQIPGDVPEPPTEQDIERYVLSGATLPLVEQERV